MKKIIHKRIAAMPNPTFRLAACHDMIIKQNTSENWYKVTCKKCLKGKGKIQIDLNNNLNLSINAPR